MDKIISSHIPARNNLHKMSNGVWSSDREVSINYTDGEASEEILKKILVKTDDVSSSSLELEASIYDWISAYHLSSERANIYRFLDLSDIENGIELGAGCGAISRYLGEQKLQLDAIEGSFNRASITALRCEGLQNVNVFHSNFNDLNLEDGSYDAVFLNGVLEYAAKFYPLAKSSIDALQKILQRSVSLINDDGVICIAIENRMGLKYWLGAPEDHYGQPHVGLYNYPSSQGIRTYDRREWQNILETLSSSIHHRFLYPFPDYKMAEVVMSDNYLRDNAYAYSHLSKISSKVNDTVLESGIHEFLLWESLQKKGYIEDYANSFFIVLSKSKARLDAICPYDFQHFSGGGRKPQYRANTKKDRDSKKVEKIPNFPEVKKNSNVVQHDLSTAEYIEGPLLVNQWIHGLLSDNDALIEKELQQYFSYLVEYCSESERGQGAIDLLPFNIVVRADDEWRAIDTEWKTSIPISPEFIYFRALFWFPQGNQILLHRLARKNNLHTILDFVRYGFQLVDKDLDDFLQSFTEQEELFQSEISNQIKSNPVEGTLLQPLTVEKSVGGDITSYIAQLYWATEKQSWAEDRSLVASGKIGIDSQSISFSLPSSLNNITSLRFDPADRPGFFRVRQITVSQLNENPDNKESWTLYGVDNIVEVTSLENIEYCKNGLGEVLVSTGDDPHLILELPAKICKWIEQTGIQFEAIVDWPKSSDYLIAMEGLGKTVVEQKLELKRLENIEKHSITQAGKLKEACDRIKAKEIYIESIDAEIGNMKQTRVWRTAEFLRAKVYYRLLDVKVLLQKSLATIRQDGVKQFLRKVKRSLGGRSNADSLGLNRSDYNSWVELNRLTDDDLNEINSNIQEFDIHPLISIIVPVYDVDQVWLEKTIASVRSQLYSKWELCLCDDLSPSPHIREVLNRYNELDNRIKIMFKDKNEGIALTSNAALSMATGDYVGLLDHDDEISVDALYENVKVINNTPGVGVIYSDEDKLDMLGRRCDPFFKPDFSPELLHSQNYICHFTVIKKSIVDELGGFREGYDGSQDHDLILRAVEKTKKVHHIPKILYHWRKIPGSTAAVYDSKSYAWEAGRKAVHDSLRRSGRKGQVSLAKFQGSYRVVHDIVENPLVSIIIPFKDKSDLLQKCIHSIVNKSTYSNFEILGVSNNSVEKQTIKLMDKLSSSDSRISFIHYDVPFNFADICNHAVDKANGEFVVLLNNDVEVISPQWLEALLNHALVEGVGAVGGKLYYPDDRIQHAGIVVGMTGVAGHSHILFHKDDVGYYAQTHVDRNVSAVTGACLMVKKKYYKQVGGMDSTFFAVAYNDVDFCLKLIQIGLRNVVTPYCEMYHYESQSRGYEDTPEKQQRLAEEIEAFRSSWQHYLDDGDPYYSPNLSLEHTNFTIRLK